MIILIFIGIVSAILATLYVIWPESYDQQISSLDLKSDLTPICFFHPFHDTGGGGERVLWTAIDASLDRFPNPVILYSADSIDLDSLDAKVLDQFGVRINRDRIFFIKLSSWRYLESKRYFRFTLILSSLGSLIAGLEAIRKLRPKIFVDTLGFPFLYPLVKFFGGSVIAYVHYPIIRKVERRELSFNNNSNVASSDMLSSIKLKYYRVFSLAYGWAGSFCDSVMVNSTWTANHINDIWQIPDKVSVVFPPCDTANLALFPFKGRKKVILSVAQFRPEKNHELQIKIMIDLFERHPEYKSVKYGVSLVMLGGVRDDGDRERVRVLQEQIDEAGLTRSILIVQNASYTTLLDYLKTSKIGLHTMSDEHFGIANIEFMASGVVALAHKSGGPKMDIITQPGVTGFLADSIGSYSSALEQILEMTPKQILEIQEAARRSVSTKFSEGHFSKSFVDALSCLVKQNPWDVAANGYSATFLSRFQPLYTTMVNASSPTAIRFLDLATGPGEPSCSLLKARQTSFELLSIDSSSEMLKLAASRMAQITLGSGVTFKTQLIDASRALEEQVGKFDTIFNSLGLMYVDIADLKQYRRMLSKGGRLVVSYWPHPSKVPALTILKRTNSSVASGIQKSIEDLANDDSTFNLWDQDKTDCLFLSNGFQIVDTKSVSLPMTFNSVFDLLNFSQGISWFEDLEKKKQAEEVAVKLVASELHITDQMVRSGPFTLQNTVIVTILE